MIDEKINTAVAQSCTKDLNFSRLNGSFAMRLLRETWNLRRVICAIDFIGPGVGFFIHLRQPSVYLPGAWTGLITMAIRGHYAVI